MRYPHVLPALVRYFNNHPSLSYWFASECVGSASQGPRPDEGARERWDELGVALGWLERLADRGELAARAAVAGARRRCSSTAPGNSHRAELNVEKLWNPHIAAHGPRHGRMGVVELRAMRMPGAPGMLAALAALFRSIVARLVVSHYRAPLVDWHDELHDRFALPAALAARSAHRARRSRRARPRRSRRSCAASSKRGARPASRAGSATRRSTLRPALEFWPLVGDVASQERASARLVDASTQRWEISLDGPGPTPPCSSPASGLRRARHRRAAAPAASVCAGASTNPSPGLHPGLPVVDPLVIEWSVEAGRVAARRAVGVGPGGGAYTGLPHDEARGARDAARSASASEPPGSTRRADAAIRSGVNRDRFTIDLRRDKSIYDVAAMLQSQSQGQAGGCSPATRRCRAPTTRCSTAAPRAPPFARVAQLLGKLGKDELARAQSARRARAAQPGRDVLGLRRRARHREDLPVLPGAAPDRRRATGRTSSAGLQQRLRALGMFLDDIYGEQKILAAGVVPAELVLGAAGYLPMLRGIKPPGGVRIHISGIDLIRDPAGHVPRARGQPAHAVGRVVRAREPPDQQADVPARVRRRARASRRSLPDAPRRDAALGVAARADGDTTPSCSRPGPYNSAYFEHSFLARTMGLELVQAPDLFVDGDKVFCRTTRGPRRVHVIYRRTDEAFLDPEVFRPDSVLGVPGLMRAYAAGNVALANAPGNGVADDKAVYPFVPEMIRVLPRRGAAARAGADLRVPARRRSRVRARAPRRAGRQGRRRGGRLRHADGAAVDRRAARRVPPRIVAEPRRYIAQHRVELSTLPDVDRRRAARVEPRRVDLRPYILTSREGPWVLPGGLTRVALVEGSYVVNSTQGGGSKDTWVHEGDAHDLARRRSLLLVRPLPRARREHRAHARRRPRNLALDAELPPAQVWRPVVVVSGEEDAVPRARRRATTTTRWGDGEVVQRYMVWDEEQRRRRSRARSAARAGTRARSARCCRLEAWEAINELHLWMRERRRAAQYAHHRDGVLSARAHARRS